MKIMVSRKTGGLVDVKEKTIQIPVNIQTPEKIETETTEIKLVKLARRFQNGFGSDSFWVSICF